MIDNIALKYTNFKQKSPVQLFFGAYCVCFGEKVLSLEQKNFPVSKNLKTEMFSQFSNSNTIFS